MLSNLLNVPLWICEDIPLEKNLSGIIHKDFFQPASAFADLKRAQDLHTSVVNGCKEADLDFRKFEAALAQYYYFLQDVEKKFPDHVVTFEWYDNFYHRPSLLLVKTWRSQQHLLVFQMGIMYSQKAHTKNMHSEDGIKKACAYFQMAGGCFQFLLDKKTDVLEVNMLACLRSLMISQAQELIWQKAVKSITMKDTVIARLSMKVADYYGEAVRYSKQAPSVTQEWINHLQVKHSHFIAAAYYRMSINALDTFEYGAQVAYLKTALRSCKDALSNKRYVKESVLEDLEGLTNTVQASLKSAEKDNDLVYLKPVPEIAELPTIVGVSMVEPKTPASLADRDELIAEAFQNLMPFAVVQVSQAFRERQETYILTSFHEPLKALNRMLRSFLAERQLPASLDTLQVPDDIPDSIVQHAQEIMSIGGARIIEDSMDEISMLAANSRAVVNECEERLRLEKQEDELMRGREGPERWTRASSMVTSAQHWTKVEKMHEYLAQGQASDAVLGDIYKSLERALRIYSGGQKALLKCIPRNGEVQLDPWGEKVAFQLRDLLAEVNQIETKRERFEASIELKSKNHSALAVVVDAFKRNPKAFVDSSGKIDQMRFEPLYEKHIAFFSTDLAYLVQSKEQQRQLETKINDAYVRFESVKQNSLTKAQEARLRVLQTLESDYVKYLELVQSLNEASKFYSAFIDRANVVLHEFDKYLQKRREEARELAGSIQEQRNFEGIEQSMARNPANIASPQPRVSNSGLWDASKGIRFS